MISNNYSHLLVIDADGQHDPSKINEFLNLNQDIEIVFGRRLFKKPMPLLRILSNTITSSIISFICKKKIHDSQCGYRRYKNTLFTNKSYNENGYQLESEILLSNINNNSNIAFVNIPTIYNSNISSMNYINDTYKFIKCILRNIN